MLNQRIQPFLTITETQNFTKAAEQLNLTQPAVSQQRKFLKVHSHIALIQKNQNPSL